MDFEIEFAQYNQVMQTLLDPRGVFAKNPRGVNVVLLRLEDLGQFDLSEDEALGRLQTNLADLIGAARSIAAEMPAPLLLCLCPASPDFLAATHRSEWNESRLRWIESQLAESTGVYFLGFDEVERLYPVAEPANPHGDRLGRIPYTDLYFAALGTAIVRHAHDLFLPPYKVIAVDCDNTLWKGVCGEDGPLGVAIDEPHRVLQEFLINQREEGMVLCLASKNQEQDVRAVFEQNPEMLLKWRHLVDWRINWEPKSESLAAISESLQLGLDSFVFLDDNPRECAEVGEGTPEVLALTLPAEGIPHFLNHIWAFDHLVVTEEDRYRSAYYQRSQQFGRAMEGSSDLASFFRTLDLRMEIHPVEASQIARVAQLTQRTNQFNFTTIRRTEAGIQNLASSSNYEVVAATVSDRFGEYGLVGVLIYEKTGVKWIVDTLLLSCRVLGRGVEHRILRWLGERAVAAGVPAVEMRLAKTDKNIPAQQFLREIRPGEETVDGENLTASFSSGELAELEFTPAEAPRRKRRSEARSEQTRRKVDYGRIARELARPEQILEAMRQESRGSVTAGVATDPHASATEKKLAQIWAELLERPAVSVSDNFFDLGGHSLLTVLLLVRVKETFGVELSIDDVYSADLTLRKLADAIETRQLAGIDSQEYAAMLAEIEGLSDEEVRLLLEREGAEESS